MKKLFSLLLTVALLLSAVAFPAMVSAEGEAITVSLAFDKETVYPGDVVNVSLMAKSNGEEAVTSATTNVYFTYDTTKLTIGELPTGFSAENGIVSLVTEVAQTIDTGGSELGKIPFTAIASENAAFDLKEVSSAFVDAELNKFSVAYTDATLPITACSATGKIKTGTDTYETITSGTTYRNSSKITIKAEVVGNADTITLTKAGAEDTPVTLSKDTDHDITEDGDYTLSILLKGQTEAITYTFTYSKISVSATLSITAPAESVNGYKVGESFTIPVTINGLGTESASMVKFSVAYDSTKLKLAALDTNLYEVDDNTIIYNKNAAADNALADKANVADLVFTVADGAANGTTKVTIDALDLALVTTVVDATSPSIGEGTAEVAVTVIPDGAFVTTSDSLETDYATSYPVAIANNSNASVKVYYSATQIATVDAATLYADTAATVVTNSFTADKEGYYYVISLIGEGPKVYDYVEVVSKVDATKPELTTPASASEWTSSVNTAIELTVSATDDKSGVASIMYSTTSAEAGFTAVENGTITFEAGTTVETIWVYAEDAVGNKTETAEISVLKDGTAPELTATVEGETIKITATDAETGIESVTVNGTPVELDGEGKHTYTAKTAGTNDYTVVATNGVEETTTETVSVTVAKAAAPSVKVAIRKSTAEDTVETTKDGFVAGGVANGRFTYVKLERYQATDNDGFKTTYTLTKDTANVEGFGNLAAAYEIDATTDANVAGEYVLTVTNTKTADGTTDTAVYNFTVVANQKDMYSVDTDAIFNAYDLAVLRKHVSGTDVSDKFTDRLSADVTADLTLDVNDAKEVLRAMQDVEYAGIYNFAIMNGIKDDDAELK